MGRSRLVYRSKHKGILSENSRKEIREAHLRRKQENTVKGDLEERDAPVREESTESADEVETSSKVDLFSLPKLYIRESELQTYERDIHMDSIQKNAIPDEEKVVHAISKTPMESLFASEFFDHSICKMVQEDGDISSSSPPISTPSKAIRDKAASLQSVPLQSMRKGVDSELQDKLDSLLGI